ncbi:hypothetical protein PoB_005399400 [Plakobranchus ocellatus]|uniref:C-type lectin domain-containing protein n=1 Tax=Plakobranchus ocellatus TaxID=259542 RepID=A0AAV4C8T2_9GAST|nr:hypothetical protein PoB_005399400 [Plakobranchus ocellatus]
MMFQIFFSFGLISQVYSRPYCPPDFASHGAYCFLLTEKKSPGETADANCQARGASGFEVISWSDQNAAEDFLKSEKETEMVWLRGYVVYSKFRQTDTYFLWVSDLHPKIKNFKELDLEKGKGRCVAMDPRDDYHWKRQNCDKKQLKALCVIKLRRYKWRNLENVKERPAQDSDFVL